MQCIPVNPQRVNAGQSRCEVLYPGPPTFEGYEVNQTVTNEEND